MAQDDIDSESGLPETVSLSTSASAAKGHDHALRGFHAAQKRKIREKNRWHDERLKGQANMRGRHTATTEKDKLYAENHGVEAGDDEGGSDMDPHLHWRMTRAMGEAEVDSGSASEGKWEGNNFSNEDDLQAPAHQNAEMLRGEEGEMGGKTRVGKHFAGKGDHNGLGHRTLQSLAPPSKYLPDHVFVAAFSKPKSENDNDIQRSQTMPKTRLPRSRKRRSVQTCTKDVVIGTRTVRTSSLSFPASTRSQPSGATLPPARINNFLANAMGLKARNKKKSSLGPRWERRPPHLGVIKRTTGAPVTGFVHSSPH